MKKALMALAVSVTSTAAIAQPPEPEQCIKEGGAWGCWRTSTYTARPPPLPQFKGRGIGLGVLSTAQSIVQPQQKGRYRPPFSTNGKTRK